MGRVKISCSCRCADGSARPRGVRETVLARHRTRSMGTNPDVIGRGQLFLIAAAAALAIAAIVFIVRPPEIGWTDVPSEPRAIAARMARHPADWRAASALTEAALDVREANRVALWRAV